MSTNKTQHYHLNQWEAEDKVLRAEFNHDNAKLDSAMAQAAQERAELRSAIPKIVTGTYQGNGAASQTIPLGFAPKAVLTMTQSGLMYSPNSSGYMFGGLALPGHSASHRYRRSISSPYEYYPGVEVTDTGFTVYETRIGEYAGVSCNSADTTYHYLAIG